MVQGTSASLELASVERQTAPCDGQRKTRAALCAFVAVLAGALLLYVHVGRSYWFLQDEWVFLVNRDLGSIDQVFRPHNTHWSTVPVLVYRLLWNVFGLNTYRPYQFAIISLHLTAGVLLRVIIRRAQVRPWFATAAASMFVLLAGSGWNDILWAFQIGYVGSLVCGLMQLILADHDGAIDRRDALGVAFGTIGLMCSGVSITMTAVVGMAVLIRRGWRAAAFHTVPLSALYIAYYFAFARFSAGWNDGGSLRDTADFVATGVRNGLQRIGRLPGYAAVAGAVLLVGLVLAWARIPRDEVRRRASMPAALLVGAMLFLTTTGLSRAGTYGPDSVLRSRYVHIFIALVLPALAVAADAIARQWRLLAPVLLVFFLAGVPRNITDLWPPAFGRQLPVRSPMAVLAIGSVPNASRVPGDVRPFTQPGLDRLTVRWLRHGIETGRIPRLTRVRPDIAADATFRISVRQVGDATPNGTCHLLVPQRVRLETYESFAFEGAVLVRLLTDDGGVSIVRGYSSPRGSRLQALAGPLLLDVVPYPETTARICDEPPPSRRSITRRAS